MAAKTKALCNGCHEDFYNDHNPLGVKECWCFKGAKVVEKTRVGIWQNPPYKWNPEARPDCYNPEHAAMIDHDDPRIA